MPDLAIIIVSHNSAAWLSPCLASVRRHAGDCRLEIVVVDNASTDGSAELVARADPEVRVVRNENRGFAHGNNRGLETVASPFVLFLNPDTEIVEGDFGELVQIMRRRATTGLVGCRQVTPDGRLYPTIRRFPRADRLLWEALGSEHFPFRATWLGERELDPAAYDRETPCDWTSGSFMLARRDAVLAAGAMDERFFIYCEEPDLCLRIKRAGWDVRHLPAMTIIHHAGKDGDNPRLAAQDAYARRQYFAKHLAPGHRQLATAARALVHVRRLAVAVAARRPARRRAALAALRVIAGRDPAPFPPPPPPGDEGAAGPLPGYAVVTPARDEQDNLARVAAALAGQTVRPVRWVIVENGSADGTPELARRLAEAHPWITLLQTEGSARYDRTSPYMRAFHAGVDALAGAGDVVVKLDADVSMEADFFARMMGAFAADPRLGITSGILFEADAGGTWRERPIFAHHCWGPTRAYRRPVLGAVLPLEDGIAYAQIDLMKAQLAGYRTGAVPGLAFRHHRPEGGGQSPWRSWREQGATAHHLGYRPSYLLARCAYRAVREEPAAVGLLVGYTAATVRGRPRYGDERIVRAIRDRQRVRHAAAAVSRR